MNKFLLSLALALLTVPALTAPLQTYSTTSSEVVLSSTEALRYQIDPDTGALILKDVQPTQTLSLPAGLGAEVRGRDTYLFLPPQASYGLLPDGQRIRISLETPKPALESGDSGTVLPSSPEALLAQQGQGQAMTATVGLLQPRMFRMEYAAPKPVADLLLKFYPRIQAEVDQRQRAVLVNAPAELLPAITQTVVELDTARPQVMFETEVLEVNRDTTQSLGLDYDNIFTFKFLEDTPGSPFKLGTINRTNGLSLNIGLNALKNTGAARVLAQPRVTTLDGVEAVINSTQNTPIVLTGTQTGSIQTITTGITMRLTPRVTPQGFIEADLVISVSSPTGSTANGVPQFSSREARTTVRVRNGEPIAIGGLIEERQVNSEEKVPGLGDIPLLGKLFTTTRTENRRSDLVIVVTPRLILPGQSVNTPLPSVQPQQRTAPKP